MAVLFVGDDWAEDHHDVEFQDENGKILRRAEIPEGMAGIAKFGEHVATFLDDGDEPEQVQVCIEVARGPWVNALIAAGYRVFGVDPRQAKRFREILISSGAKSDKADAHALTEMLRHHRGQLRESGGDSEIAAAVRVVARAHQTMIWERTRQMLRLRAALREYFPAMLLVCAELELDLWSRPFLGLLAKAPTPVRAGALTTRQILPLLKRRHNKDAKAAAMQRILRAEHLGQPERVTDAYAASVRSLVAVLGVLNEQIDELATEVDAHFSQHPDYEIYCSQPGMGPAIAPRVLAEFGDDPNRFRNAKARKNYAGTSPITIQSGKSEVVSARYVHNDRLLDAVIGQAHGAFVNDPGARAYYRKQRARDVDHYAALRQVANRLVGILHGCLVRGVPYDPEIAWKDQTPEAAA